MHYWCLVAFFSFCMHTLNVVVIYVLKLGYINHNSQMTVEIFLITLSLVRGYFS